MAYPSFQQDFDSEDGINLLFTVLERLLNNLRFLGAPSYVNMDISQSNLSNKVVEEVHKTNDIIYTLVMCIKKFIDTKDRLQKTISHPTALTSLFRVLFDVQLNTARQRAGFIISVICLLPTKYHAIGSVLTALDVYVMNF